ncbi:hypothetical protein HZC00_04840 [Candidatus Kaiserbacteria bacterium]|nr:hypothetical protein [Candidatus Kaiserbacteria bacterium]
MEEKMLDSLGLNHKEIGAYRAMLKLGTATPVSLGKAAGVKRTTAYSIARNLVDKGLLVEDVTTRPRTFTLAKPVDVLALLDEEKKRLHQKEIVLKAVADELTELSTKTHYPVPTLRFIEENKIASFLKQQTPIWDKNILDTGETTWWGFQDHAFVEHYGDWISWYWAQSPQPIDLKLLSNFAESEVKFGKKLAPRRLIKYWGEAALFRSTLWAIGDYMVMINTRTKPFYLVEIHDSLMANDQREVFKNLWPLV